MPFLSTQPAEHATLTHACILFKDEPVTIFFNQLTGSLFHMLLLSLIFYSLLLTSGLLPTSGDSDEVLGNALGAKLAKRGSKEDLLSP